MAVRTAWGRRDGASEEKLLAIAEFESRPEFSERERAALRFAQSFIAELGFVTEEVFAATRRHFADAEIVELAFSCWQFSGGNWFMHALAIEPQGELTEYYGGGAPVPSSSTRANA